MCGGAFWLASHVHSYPLLHPKQPCATLCFPPPYAVVLTVLSCLAGNARLRSAMARCRARRRLVDFGQRNPDPRLRARSLSLVKVGAPVWCKKWAHNRLRPWPMRMQLIGRLVILYPLCLNVPLTCTALLCCPADPAQAGSARVVRAMVLWRGWRLRGLQLAALTMILFLHWAAAAGQQASPLGAISGPTPCRPPPPLCWAASRGPNLPACAFIVHAGAGLPRCTA